MNLGNLFGNFFPHEYREGSFIGDANWVWGSPNYGYKVTFDKPMSKEPNLIMIWCDAVSLSDLNCFGQMIMSNVNKHLYRTAHVSTSGSWVDTNSSSLVVNATSSNGFNIGSAATSVKFKDNAVYHWIAVVFNGGGERRCLARLRNMFSKAVMAA